MKMILLAMQDPAQLRIHRYLLEQAGHTVIPVSSASTAIEALKRRQDFNVIIASQGVGEPSGLDVLAFAKNVMPEATTVLTDVTYSEKLERDASHYEINEVTHDRRLKKTLERLELIPGRREEALIKG